METPRSLMQDLLTFRSSDAKRMWKEQIMQRDGGRCVYCGDTDQLTIDHVRPRSKGGATTASNCVTACLSCNQAKGSMEVESFVNQTLSLTNYVYSSSILSPSSV
jgi:5-methylcytosine-specific restriction endonuclease McrA